MVVVRQMGLASALGALEGAAAAFRAGLVSLTSAPDVEQMQPGDDRPRPVAVHALPSESFGFTGLGRLTALLAEALADLGTRLDLAKLPPKAPVFVGLPSLVRRESMPLIDDDMEPVEDPRDPRLDAAARLILQRAGEAIGWRVHMRGVSALAEGETAFAVALAAARDACLEHGAPGALVIAVDSLVDPAVLDQEMAEGRVKTGENQTGYMPGEAAVAAWVTSREPGDDGVLVVHAISLTPPLAEGEAARRPDGRTLATCVIKAAGRLPGGTPPTLFSDHDGRTATALELGYARHVLAARGSSLADAPIVYPVLGFGRTGAASGGVGIAVASRALVRGWARTPAAVVLSVADSGARAAIMISAGPSSQKSERR